jgi:hypothetical protein
LFFKESFTNSQIVISCNEQQRETDKNTFIAGEGGPEKVINSSLYPIIGGGKVYLYGTKKQSDCSYPVVEIHELMHVFGFNHITNKSSILYPYLDCKQRLDTEIINELRRLYSIEPKSELKIVANVSKAGAYLNFNVAVENIGIIIAKNVALRIKTSDNTPVEDFKLDDIEPGTVQTLNVKNLKLPSRNTNEIVIEVTTSSPEFYLENNFLTARLG